MHCIVLHCNVVHCVHLSGEGEVEDDGGREVRAVASMRYQTNTAELVVEADEVAAVKKVSEGAPTTVVSADDRRGSVAEGLADVWVENRRGVEVGLSSRLRGSVPGVFGVPVLSISQRSCPVDTSRSACPVTADREAKKEALIADFERKQAELKALYLTKIQELELEREPDVVADADRFEGSDAASGTQIGKPHDPS
jgi:hypothetical protein